VASQEVLKKTAARYIERIRAPKVEAFHIELKYEEPVRLHDSDQVQYLPEKTINPDTLKGKFKPSNDACQSL
jgi:hypothetical protein